MGWGSAQTSRRYSIKSVAEAEAYLSHSVLGPRLVECAEAATPCRRAVRVRDFRLPRRDEAEVLRRTLFACVAPAGSVFDRLIDKYFQGQRDGKTLHLLSIAPEAK